MFLVVLKEGNARELEQDVQNLKNKVNMAMTVFLNICKNLRILAPEAKLKSDRFFSTGLFYTLYVDICGYV